MARLRCETRPCLLNARIGPFRAIWRHLPIKWANGPSGGRKARKRKFGKNNGLTGQWSFGNPEHPRGGQRCFLNGRKRIFEKLLTFFW